MSKIKVIEKEFKILEVDKKNKNHRTYTTSLVNKWINNAENDDSESVYDLEYAIDEINPENGEPIERDVYNEFISGSLNCGEVGGFKIVDNILYATVKFKLPEFCFNLTKELYESNDLEKYSIVPKGKGSVKNQTIQDDYELYGFNLILKEDSSFNISSEENVETVK